MKQDGNERWDMRPMRIAAMQVESKKEETFPILDKWCEGEFNVEQLLHAYGDNYYGIFDAPRHEEILREYISRAHEKGLKIIAYANVMSLPPVPPGPMIGWNQVDKDGGETHGTCVNSPYREYALKGARGVMECGAEGLFMDGPHFGAECCYCTSCRTQFQEKYKRPMPTEQSSEKDWEMFWEFRRDSITRFVRDINTVVKSVRADGILYLNHFVFCASANDGQWADDLMPLMDWIGSEGGFQFYGYPQKANLWKVSATAKMLEAMAPQKPRVIFIDGANCPWNYLIHTPAETELMIASTAANAASHWYCFCVGLQDFKAPAWETVKSINAQLKEHEDCYAGTQSAAKVALFWSQDTLEVYDENAPESDLNLTGMKAGPNTDIPLANKPGWSIADLPSASREPVVSFHSIYRLLWRSQVPFDLAHDHFTSLEQLQRYEVIVMPNAVCMSAKMAGMMREYVKQGGKLIAWFESSLSNEKGERQSDFQLADVFGTSFEGHLKDFHHYAKMDVPLDHPVGKGLYCSVLPAPRHGLVCKESTATPIIRYYEPCPEYYMPLPKLDVPALFHNRFGNGECYYFAAKFAENYAHYGFGEYRQMFLNILDEFTQRQLRVECASETVEATLRCLDNPRRLLLHLINYTGSHVRPIPQIVPLQEVKVELRCEKPQCVSRVLTGTELPFEWEDGMLRFTLPRLDTYALVDIRMD